MPGLASPKHNQQQGENRMKVLAIVSSARKTGNSEILAKAMLAALPDSAEKRLLRLPDLAIEPCKACYACLDKGASCIINDEFNELLRQVRQADAVILASPVYFLGMHTRLKLVCDRLISVLNEADAYTGRRCVVAIPYGVEGWQGYGVEATVSVARFLHLDLVGVLPVQAANPGEVVQPEVLDQAVKMALRLIDDSAPPAGDKLLPAGQDAAGIVCAVCGSGLLRLNKTGAVTCVICGAAGSVEIGGQPGQTLDCRWDSPDHYRYSRAGMTEHAERLESIKQDFIARRIVLLELRKPYRMMEFEP
jgi:NAD(P)H-dependent FMN reductase